MAIPKKPTRKASAHESREKAAALAELESDLIYRYGLHINKAQMLSYQHLCKRKGTSANKELCAFVRRQLQANDIGT